MFRDSLSPDPLGRLAEALGSSNAYAYVNNNPLSYIDPWGLILFAFDGTGNDLSNQTNVQHFSNAYDSFTDYDKAKKIDKDPLRYYTEGPGTSADDWLDGSAIGGAIAPRLRRIVENQITEFDNYVKDRTKWEIEQAARAGKRYTKDNPLDIYLDVVGFSRGAAAAREFMNRIYEQTKTGHYRFVSGEYACVRVIQRFAGLFDTVLGTNTDGRMRMAIPEAVQYVAHAVALNEHRSLFPLESIETSYKSSGFSSNRTERGFVGAHSDIGGGYTVADGGDLSDVALNWMVQQATGQGLKMKELPLEQCRITSPIVHDPRRDVLWRALGQATTDSEVRYPNASDAPASNPKGKAAPIQGLDYKGSERLDFIKERTAVGLHDTKVGDVDMKAYAAWLKTNYGLSVEYN